MLDAVMVFGSSLLVGLGRIGFRLGRRIGLRIHPSIVFWEVR